MKVTAQEEYGLRCLLQLARRAPRPAPTTVREIAANEGLSTAYTVKLLRLLGRARLAESVRGIRGGYRISRPPDRITLGEVVRALGGVLSPEELCRRYTGNQDVCAHEADCSLRPVWSTLRLQLERFLDNVLLSALLDAEPAVLSGMRSLESRLVHLDSTQNRGTPWNEGRPTR